MTYGREGLEEFIHPNQIIKELGGAEDWEYSYEEPVPGENDAMKDTATRDALQRARDDLTHQFEAATKDWITEPEGARSNEIKAKREAIAVQLRENFWKLDKYVRARSLYDRRGNIRPGAKAVWYPEREQNHVGEKTCSIKLEHTEDAKIGAGTATNKAAVAPEVPA